jgi:VWFA-related protein
MTVRIPILGIILLSATTALAQQGSQPGLPPADHKVVLDVVVAQQPGNPVAGLHQQDFAVLDNKAALPVESFRAVSGAEAPVEVILVVDAINTGYSQIALARGQIENFLRANGGKLSHPTTIVLATETGLRVQQGYTTDGNALAAQLESATIDLRSVGRSAGFRGAEERFQTSVDSLGQLVSHEAARPGRKIVLWISPGWPLLAGTTPGLSRKDQQSLFNRIVKLSTQMRQANVTLYSIDPVHPNDLSQNFYYEAFVKGVKTASSVQIADLSLQVLAVQSGGLALNSNNSLEAMLQQCVADTSAYYELSFNQPPSTRPDEYHQVQVQLTRSGTLARTREGYYSQP